MNLPRFKEVSPPAMLINKAKQTLSLALLVTATSAGFFAAPAQAVALTSFATTSTLARCDDCSSKVPIGFSVKFGSSTFSSAWVNNNGSISFEQLISSWSGGTFGSMKLGTSQSVLSIIAPFFGDVDTRTLGTVSVGSGTYNGAQAFAVTWSKVGGYGVSTSYTYPAGFINEPGQNSFQLVLTNRADTGAGNFDIYFNYQSVEWSVTSASMGSYATQGMQSADGTVAYNVPGSGNAQQLGAATPAGRVPVVNPIALISGTNNGVAGQRYFQIRGGSISTISAVPEPDTWAMMLLGSSVISSIVRYRRRQRQGA